MSVEELHFGVLGPLTAARAGQPLCLGGRKQRLVLAALLMNSGRSVSADRLIQTVWGDEQPERALATLQVHISNLRRALVGAAPVIITQAPGYILPASAADLDLLRFEELATLGQDRALQNQPAEAHDLFAAALGLWRGDAALADLDSEPYANSVRSFLGERRLGVEEDRIKALLDLARDREAHSRAESLLAEQPLRESLWEMSILALYRLGRQGDALAAYRRCRTHLMEELGIEPMPRLRTLEQRILRQDRNLELSPVGTGSPGQGHGKAEGVDVTVRRRSAEDAHVVLDDGSHFSLTDRVTCGRHPDCDIVLDDPSVSRRHAEIRRANGAHLLLDLSSSNGTWVAGEQVMQHLLRDGEVIGIGDHHLVYRVPSIQSRHNGDGRSATREAAPPLSDHGRPVVRMGESVPY